MKTDRQSDQAWIDTIRQENLERAIQAARGVMPRPTKPAKAPVPMAWRLALLACWLGVGVIVAAVAASVLIP